MNPVKCKNWTFPAQQGSLTSYQPYPYGLAVTFRTNRESLPSRLVGIIYAPVCFDERIMEPTEHKTCPVKCTLTIPPPFPGVSYPPVPDNKPISVSTFLAPMFMIFIIPTGCTLANRSCHPKTTNHRTRRACSSFCALTHSRPSRARSSIIIWITNAQWTTCLGMFPLGSPSPSHHRRSCQ